MGEFRALGTRREPRLGLGCQGHSDRIKSLHRNAKDGGPSSVWASPDTLTEMLRLGILTGQARVDAEALVEAAATDISATLH